MVYLYAIYVLYFLILYSPFSLFCLLCFKQHNNHTGSLSSNGDHNSSNNSDGGNNNSDEEERRHLAKQRMLGNVKFIGELKKLDMLSEKVLHDCISELLQKKKKRSTTKEEICEDMECLAQLLKTCGKNLDSEQGKDLMNQYFEILERRLNYADYPPRIRFLLKDVIDLRENNWVPRRLMGIPEGPVPIKQIRGDDDDRIMIASNHHHHYGGGGHHHHHGGGGHHGGMHHNSGPHYINRNRNDMGMMMGGSGGLRSTSFPHNSHHHHHHHHRGGVGGSNNDDNTDNWMNHTQFNLGPMVNIFSNNLSPLMLS